MSYRLTSAVAGVVVLLAAVSVPFHTSAEDARVKEEKQIPLGDAESLDARVERQRRVAQALLGKELPGLDLQKVTLADAADALRDKTTTNIFINWRALEAAGVPPDTPIVGTEGGREFFRVLVRAEAEDMDLALAERDILEAGRALVAEHPEVGAIVLECTNMPPYAAVLQQAFGLPVFDITTLVTWLQAGLRPRRFG